MARAQSPDSEVAEFAGQLFFWLWRASHTCTRSSRRRSAENAVYVTTPDAHVDAVDRQGSTGPNTYIYMWVRGATRTTKIPPDS
jgi:hypothetical protein